jgi:hypothetical protein
MQKPQKNVNIGAKMKGKPKKKRVPETYNKKKKNQRRGTDFSQEV